MVMDVGNSSPNLGGNPPKLTLRKRLGLRLLKWSFVRRCVEEQANLDAFKKRPTFRMVLGMILVGISMLASWPIAGLFSLIALLIGKPLMALVGPGAYLVSWLVWLAGMALLGVEGSKYGLIFVKWLVRVGVQALVGQNSKSLLVGENELTRNNLNSKE